MNDDSNEKNIQNIPAVKKRFDKDYIWVFTTYFTEGFPYSIIRSIASLFFRSMNAPLAFVGLTSVFSIPWALKFLWGPWVDEFSTKRRWMIGMQVPFLILIVLVALAVPLDNNIYIIYGLFVIGSLIAPTNDTAIDGYYMEALDKEGQSKFVGYRTMAFRLAWMTGNGIIATIGTTQGWFLAFMTAAVVFGLFYFYHLFFLKEVQVKQKDIHVLLKRISQPKPLSFIAGFILVGVGLYYFSGSSFYSGITNRVPFLKKMELSHWVALLLLVTMVLVGIYIKRFKNLLLKNPDSNYSRAFISFMDKEKIGVILAFIILLRFGEWTLSNMVAPFIVDLGIKVHYGWISAGVALPSSIVGAMLGGWLISRYSLKRMIWPLILAQNFVHVFYTLLAVYLTPFVKLNTGAEHPASIGMFNLVLVAVTNGFDQFAGGLGNAVLMTYLMRICHKDFKAAHYAIGTGLMSVMAPYAGVLSGLIAGWLGYAWLFGISFVFTIPGMVLISFLPYLTDEPKPAEIKK